MPFSFAFFRSLLKIFDKEGIDLSGGEKQRLLLAMSMVSQKPIIVFDEPTSGLCKMQMDILIGFLNQMVEQGKTIIIITHDFEFIKQCDGAIYEFLK